MKKLLVALTIATALISSPAFANSCPLIMKDIDKALQTASLDAETKAKVMELRKKGEELHKSGDHAASVKTLNEARALIQ